MLVFKALLSFLYLVRYTKVSNRAIFFGYTFKTIVAIKNMGPFENDLGTSLASDVSVIKILRKGDV
jgi:hypothetical protein